MLRPDAAARPLSQLDFFNQYYDDKLSAMVDDPAADSSPRPGRMRLPSFMIDPSRPAGAPAAPIVSPPDAPFTPTQAVPHGPPPSYRLYRPGAVGWATFTGTPLAGAILMGINFRRVGRRSSSRKAFWFGLLGTAALIGISLLLPQGFPATGIAVGALFAMVHLAAQKQGEMIHEHVARGGDIESNWKAAGLGLLTILVLALAIFVAILAQVLIFSPTPPRHIEILKGQDIVFDGSATEADAKLLGRDLKDAGLFDDSGNEKTVLLSKDSNGVKLSFFVDERKWNDSGIQDRFRELAKVVADSGLGRPLEVHMVDQKSKSHWHARIE